MSQNHQKVIQTNLSTCVLMTVLHLFHLFQQATTATNTYTLPRIKILNGMKLKVQTQIGLAYFLMDLTTELKSSVFYLWKVQGIPWNTTTSKSI